MSKRWIMGVVVITAVALLTAVAPTLHAGEYHYKANLKCAQCHTMHYSMQHTYDGTGTVGAKPAGGSDVQLQSWLGGGPGTGPNPNLLRAATPNDLCLTCHNGQTFAPDVYGANTNTYVREAGGVNDSTAPDGYQTWMGHTLGGAKGTEAPHAVGTTPFTTGGLGLLCIDCHDNHGNSNYRNLAASNDPNHDTTPVPVTYNGSGAGFGAKDLAKDVFVDTTKAAGLEGKYGQVAVNFCEPAHGVGKSAIANFCNECHVNFHNTSTNANTGTDLMDPSTQWIRHPTSGVYIGIDNKIADGVHSDIGRFQGLTNKVKVMDKDGLWNATSTNVGPTCISCHKAHGNKNPFGLVYMKGTGTITEEGDDGTAVTNLCQQCHDKGT